MNFMGPTFLYNSTEALDTAQRVRVIAGPNGSGKSTVINQLRSSLYSGRHLDFGHYVNADDIAQELIRTGRHSLLDCWISDMDTRLIVGMSEFAGFLSGDFDRATLSSAIKVKKGYLYLLRPEYAEHVAQMVADVKRRLFLFYHKKFSFETVFSHPSKVEFLRIANIRRFKVYFYFVGTESPEINLYRVASRVQNQGHNVPMDRIINRYRRAMNLMWGAAQYAYQAYFFDNSVDNQPSNMFAHFKVIEGKKVWDIPSNDNVPIWFRRHYRKESLEYFKSS